MTNPNNREERELRERQLRRDVQVARDSENTTNGLFLGILLAATAGLVTLFFVLNQRTPIQQPAQVPQVNVQPPDVNVEVPAQAPAPQVTSPDINVTVPPAPPAPPAPNPVTINLPPAADPQPAQSAPAPAAQSQQAPDAAAPAGDAPVQP